MHLFTGPGHPYADAPAITPAHLAGHRIWMPGNAPGTEWTACYEALAEAFGFAVDTVGPDFGIEPLLDTIAGSTALAAFLSRQTPLAWPAGHALRRIPLANPTPVSPHCLIWRPDNPHPSLAALRDRLAAARPAGPRVASGFGSGAGHGPGMTVPVRSRVRGRCSGRAFPGAGARFAYDRRDCWDR
ncbi:LysR substrate binding domain protein [Streptomyces sp. ADI96-15]|nr:LysR substrate binding domain protein [Streptomyces sp. ADI96-15]